MIDRRGPGERDPFDGWPFTFDPTGMMEEMLEMMKGLDAVDGGVRSRSYGYRMTVGPDGDRRVEVYGDVPDDLLPADLRETSTRLPGPPEDEGPVSDVMECGGSFVVTVEMPGVSDGDIDVTVDGMEMRIEAAGGRRTYEKTIGLPGHSVPDSLRRTFVNGILEVTLDRADECSGDKHI